MQKHDGEEAWNNEKNRGADHANNADDDEYRPLDERLLSHLSACSMQIKTKS